MREFRFFLRNVERARQKTKSYCFPGSGAGWAIGFWPGVAAGKTLEQPDTNRVALFEVIKYIK